MTTPPDRPRIRFFAGPSIRWHEIEELCAGIDAEIEIAPPIEQGDLLQEIHQSADVIGIIDGYFYQVPSVLHKEILLAIQAGSRVLGAASLGALRAAELDIFGMEGVGRIYEMFADGSIDGDDEVAVQHGPEEIGYQPVTVPLVNVRHAIRLAIAEGFVGRSECRSILSVAQDIHFTKRTWSSVFEHNRFESINNAAAFRNFVTETKPDLKYQDARKLVETVVDRIRRGVEWPSQPECQVKSSKYTHLMWHEYVGSRAGTRHVQDSQVVSIQKVLDLSFSQTVERVARRIIACDEATILGLVSRSTLKLEREFREENDLLDNQRFHDWLTREVLSKDELITWLQSRDLERQVVRHFSPSEASNAGNGIIQAAAARRGLDEHDLLALTLSRQTIAFDIPLIRELKCTGRFAEARESAARILDSVDAAFEGNPRLRAIMEAMGDLARKSFDEWASDLWGVQLEALPDELLRRAIHSGAEFIDTVRLCKLHSDRVDGRADSRATSTTDEGKR
ncbi:MAG: TfuA-like protein [Planctomycetota bacterium]|jgi:hypothetical protein